MRSITAMRTAVIAIVTVMAIVAGACADDAPAREPIAVGSFETATAGPPPTPAPTPGRATPEPNQATLEQPAPSGRPSAEQLDEAIAALVPAGSPGAIVRVDIGGMTMVDTAVGETAFGSGESLSSEHPFRLASTTKPITAATVLRLHEQGLIDLDDPIAPHLPADLVSTLHVLDGVSHGGDITVRHLLTHTSGLADRPFDTPFVADVGADPGRVWEPRDLVDYLGEHADPKFVPGEGYAYADDGYVLLGMIIEAVAGRPLHEVYRELVLDPLGMDETYLEGQESPRGLPLSHPYLDGVDGTTIHPSTDWGGGGLVSTTADLVRFGTAIKNGRLFEDPATHAAMTTDAGSGYGLGLYIAPVAGATIIGHDGFWGSTLMIIPELDLVLAATINQFAEDDVRAAFAFQLIDLVLTATQPSRPENVATVEIGGRTHAYVASAGTSSEHDVTIVLEAGLGDGIETWVEVTPGLAGVGRVFAHDRAGYGDSEVAPGPRDGLTMVEELRAVLAAAGQEPPYVLVGHSLGGLLMELFARTHPDEVVGLVLVDSRPAAYGAACEAALGADLCGPSDDMLAQAPQQIRAEWQGLEATERQVHAAPPATSLPAVVLASNRSDGRADTDELWVQAQRELATALDARLVLTDESNHYIQLYEPELVVDAVRSVLSAGSSG